MKTIAFLILLMLLFACAPGPIITPPPIEPEKNVTLNVTADAESADAESVENLNSESESVEEVVGEEVEVQPAEESGQEGFEEQTNEVEKVGGNEKIKTKIEELLPRFAQGVKSYSFNYRKNKYYVRGPLMKIILGDFIYEKDVDVDGKTYKQVYLDVIYLDREAKRAVGYCEGLTSQVKPRCVELELEDVRFPRLYADYIIRLPEDWLFEFLNRIPHLVEKNKYFVESRPTTLVKFIDPDKSTELYFDETIGLPLRVLIKQGEFVVERYDYEKLVANRVREVDVIHRSASEIPSEEVFYAR